jgi:hypothetical protein
LLREDSQWQIVESEEKQLGELVQGPELGELGEVWVQQPHPGPGPGQAGRVEVQGWEEWGQEVEIMQQQEQEKPA